MLPRSPAALYTPDASPRRTRDSGTSCTNPTALATITIARMKPEAHINQQDRPKTAEQRDQHEDQRLQRQAEVGQSCVAELIDHMAADRPRHRVACRRKRRE